MNLPRRPTTTGLSTRDVGGATLNSQNLAIIIGGVALAITVIGWKKVLVWSLAGLVTLAVLGLIQVVAILSTGI